jgi:hypothetical protein
MELGVLEELAGREVLEELAGPVALRVATLRVATLKVATHRGLTPPGNRARRRSSKGRHKEWGPKRYHSSARLP